MHTLSVARLALLSLMLAAVACGDSSGDHSDAAVTDASAHQDATTDAGDTTDAQRGPDAGPLPAFPVRVPAAHEFTCNNESYTFYDIDWLCRIPMGNDTIDLYLQATPTGCTNLGWSPVPEFDQTAAWYLVPGSDMVLPTTAQYRWGGNHHNEEIAFAYQGSAYDIWHSSIGFGFRVCAEPDCLIACEAGTSVQDCDSYAQVETDGCVRDSGGPPPPVQVLCGEITADGQLPALTDPWTSDPPRLPCLGE